MSKNWLSFSRRHILSLFILATVVGCGGVHFEPDPPGEIKSGPGIFSESSGEYTLYSSEKEKQRETVSAPGTDAGEATSQTQASEPAVGQPAAAPAISSPDAGANDYKEFELWKEYQAWKSANPDAQEFEDWKKWKAYQEWKANQ